MRLWAVSSYAFVILRKNRLFLPFLAGVPAIFLLAYISGSWTIEEAERIQVNLTALGLHLGGSFVTLLWGSQLFCTGSSENPAIEFELVAPVPGSSWIVGRFLGLAAHLALACLLFFILWCALFTMAGTISFSWQIVWMFAAQFLGWLSLGALCGLLGTLCRRNLALLAGAVLWMVGLMNPQGHLPSDRGSWLPILSQVWNWQRFNPVSYEPTDLVSCLYTLLWASGLMSFMLAAACYCFKRRRLLSL